MKRMLCLLLAMLVLAVCGAALAEDESVWDFDTYNFELEDYTGAGGDLCIPDMIQGCTVDIIGLNAFNTASGITSLTMPDTLRQIDDGAIAYCDDLTSVTLNDGLLVIGRNCFTGNPLVEEVTIPSSVCYIGSSSFTSCENLRKVTFEGECPVFDGASFDWLPEDLVIYVPDDCYDAYYAAFSEMLLDPDVRSSGAAAESFDFSCDPGQFAFDSETGTILAYEGYDVRVDVPAEIGGVAVHAIGNEAFRDCSYLCYLSLPEGLESIGNSAFEGCARMLHIDFPSTLRTIGSRAFAGGMQVWQLELPEGLERIGSEAFCDSMQLSGTLQLPQGLREIGERAFSGCGWLEEVYFPASVERIGENAFAGCGMSYVVFEGLALPEMPESVFADCWYLSDIDLHTKASKQQMLDLQAVMDGLGLECRVWRMQNPDVDYIQDGFDSYESGVLTAYTGEQTHLRPWDTYDEYTVTAVGDGVFRGNTFIEYFSVPYNDAFTTIGAEAFADSSLMQIDLFDSVTTINGGAFRNCTGLTELTLPESVSFVGVEALNGCTELRKLIVLCDPTVLPEDLLVDCPADMEIYAGTNATEDQLKYLSAVAGRAFYDPVTRLGEEAPEMYAMPYDALPGEDFWYDGDFARLDRYEGYARNLVLPRQIDGTLLTMLGGGMMSRAACGDDYEMELPVVSVVIPESYTEIVPYAFANCETLETVICYAPLELLPDCAFQNCTALREIIFVNGVHSIGMNVFDNCPSLESVYIGPYAEYISDSAFLNSDGTVSFDQSTCITDPAGLPDIDALLEAVKCDPMPEPTPEPAAVAVPVGEEGAPFFGLWHGTEMVLDNTVYSLSDFEMVMTIYLGEDGRMVMSESETIDLSLVGDGDWFPWHVEGETAFAEYYSMTLQADGRLCLEEEGMQMLFVRGDEAVAPAPAPLAPAPAAPAPEAPAAAPAAPAQAGMTGVKYICASAEMEGYTIDASMLGGEYSLVFHENGTADFVMAGAAIPGIGWEKLDSGNFCIDYYGSKMEIVWTDGGFEMNYFDTMLMYFVPEN